MILDGGLQDEKVGIIHSIISISYNYGGIMINYMLANYDGMRIYHVILWFFLYSFFGWCMECCVIRKQLGYWENRGFAKLPFCIIYGFGCLIAFVVFSPISNNLPALFVAGVIGGTGFEYLTAMVMLRLFGNLWWNYDHKRFNYKGILCLQSSIAWGVICVLLFRFVNVRIKMLVMSIDSKVAIPLSMFLTVAYTIDFSIQFYRSLSMKKHESIADNNSQEESMLNEANN